MARYVETDMAAARAAPTAGSTPNLIRWGAVFGGVIIGLSLLLLLSMLWVALAWGADIQAMQDNIAWWTAASAVVAMFIGGMLAGWLSGVPGAGSGFFNGLAVWALILIGSLLIGVPGALQAVNIEAVIGAPEVDLAMNGGALWAAFFSLLVGALAAGIGGAIGGAMTRPAFADSVGPTFGPGERRDEHYRDRDDRYGRHDDADRERQPESRSGDAYAGRRDPERGPHRDFDRDFDRDRDRDFDRGTTDRGFDREPAHDERADQFSDRPPDEERPIDLREEEAGRRREP